MFIECGGRMCYFLKPTWELVSKIFRSDIWNGSCFSNGNKKLQGTYASVAEFFAISLLI